ncbi:hypothetical protein [Stenotrophomonas acidaminiphila]|uniref:hypothetical protein n=1 Tax=Stenotrophomonas acidaminiphila TaxID=128780 RepID=UPI0024ACDF9B|nr:hypothetical protein [Stenotrophomonas acidaminiphila]WHL17651.1 hypothetical protein QLF99_11270 [Stenotrophomonas acidaminiphila]
MKEPITGRDLVVISAISAGFGLLLAWGLFYRWGSAPPHKPIDLPAWVQAIGSVLAIGVAIWIPWRESRRRDAEMARALEVQATLVAGGISPLISIYLRRISFYRRMLDGPRDQATLKQAIREDCFDVLPALLNYQPLLNPLGRTGILANEFIGELYLLTMGVKIIHHETVTIQNHRRMIEICDRAGRVAETLLRELDEICPPRRDEFS